MKTKNYLLILFFLFFFFQVKSQFSLKSDGRFVLGPPASGLRSNVQGQFLLGTNKYDDGWFGGAIRIHPYNDLGISIYSAHTFDYGDVIKVVADRPKTAALAVWNGNNLKSFYVLGNGQVYSYGQFTLSDGTLKKNVETIDSPLQKVLKLRGVTYDFIEQEKTMETSDPSGLDMLTPTTRSTIAAEQSRKHMGVIAQEVEAIIPEVVRTTVEGKKAVAYSELVGLLIEAVKEQQEQILELRSQISQLSMETSIETDANKNMLSQNFPNPVVTETKIGYNLVETIANATLYIHTIQGQLIKEIKIKDRGQNYVKLDTKGFHPGIYLYSLNADGKVIDSKRMIIN